MANSGNYSNLLDPLILKSDIAQPLTPIWNSLSKLNWKFIIINVMLPLIFILIVAFQLKSRYDKKKQLYDDYYVTETPHKSIIF